MTGMSSKAKIKLEDHYNWAKEIPVCMEYRNLWEAGKLARLKPLEILARDLFYKIELGDFSQMERLESIWTVVRPIIEASIAYKQRDLQEELELAEKEALGSLLSDAITLADQLDTEKKQ